MRNRIAVLAAVLFGLAIGTVVMQGWAAAVPVVLGGLVVGVLVLAVGRGRDRDRS